MRKLLILLIFQLLWVVSQSKPCDNPYKYGEDKSQLSVQVDYLKYYFNEDCWSPKDIYRRTWAAEFYDNFANVDPSKPFYGWYLKSKDPTAEGYLRFTERINVSLDRFPSLTKTTLFPFMQNDTMVRDGQKIIYIPQNHLKNETNLTYDFPLSEDSYILTTREMFECPVYVIPKKTEGSFIIKFGKKISQSDESGPLGKFGNLYVNGTLPALIKDLEILERKLGEYYIHFILYDGSIWRGNVTRTDLYNKQVDNLQMIPDLVSVNFYLGWFYSTYYIDDVDGEQNNYPNNETVKLVWGREAYQTTKGEIYYRGQKLNDLPNEPLIYMTTNSILKLAMASSDTLFLLYGDRVIIITTMANEQQQEGIQYFYKSTILIQDSEKNKYDKIQLSYLSNDGIYEIYLFSGVDYQIRVRYSKKDSHYIQVLHDKFQLINSPKPFFDYVLTPVEEGQAAPINLRVHNLWQKTNSSGDSGKGGDDDDTTIKQSSVSILFSQWMLLSLLLLTFY